MIIKFFIIEFIVRESCDYSGTFDKGHSERGQTSQLKIPLYVYTLYTNNLQMRTVFQATNAGSHYFEIPLLLYRALP